MTEIKGSADLEQKVLNQQFCAGCGACVGLCGYFGTFQGRVVMLDSCKLAEGRCYAYCPRIPTDTEQIRSQFFDESDHLQEVGPNRGLFMMRISKEYSSAGNQRLGNLTALLKLAMEKGFIDSAILPFSGEEGKTSGVLVSRPEELESRTSGAFQLTPTLLATLNKTLKENRYKRIGVVGTPCQTLAVFKMKCKPFSGHSNNVDNIALVIGLFCRWGREACHYCTDFTAEFSDLSIEEERNPKGKNSDPGWSQVIARTPMGIEILKMAEDEGVLEIRDFGSEDLEKLKKASLNKKTKALRNLAKRKDDAQP